MAKTLLLSTRKGLIIYKKSHGQWKYQSVHFVGIPVSLSFVDKETSTWWACLDHGHWGCKLHKSYDEGASWEEVEAPKYPENAEIKDGIPAAVKYLWAFNKVGDKLLIGTDPGGLFESTDSGASFKLNQSLWDHPTRKEGWFGGGRDNPGIHSIIIDPKNDNHWYIGISCAGVFETHDGGKNWNPKNKGLKADFLPNPTSDIGQDPHLVVACPNQPEMMWQQNHCGIYVSKNGGEHWDCVSEEHGIAHFGFAIEVDEKNGNTAWVVPATSDQNRVAVDLSLCVSRTEDGGKSWQHLRNGLPQKNVFDIVYRHALSKQADELIFGTTTGNIYASGDGGENWETISNTLPMVYATELV